MAVAAKCCPFQMTKQIAISVSASRQGHRPPDPANQIPRQLVYPMQTVQQGWPACLLLQLAHDVSRLHVVWQAVLHAPQCLQRQLHTK